MLFSKLILEFEMTGFHDMKSFIFMGGNCGYFATLVRVSVVISLYSIIKLLLADLQLFQ